MNIIEPILLHGAENAISLSNLTEIAKYDSPRATQKQIERERLDGVPILSGNKGYYLPSDDVIQANQEIAKFKANMKARAFSILKVQNKIGV